MAKTSRPTPIAPAGTATRSTLGAMVGSELSASLMRDATAATAAIGTLTRNTHRHPAASTKTAPAVGPMAAANPAMAPQIPIAVSRRLPSTACKIRASEAGINNAPPIPWITRAVIRTASDGARPDNNEPVVKIHNPATKTRRRPLRSASQPPMSKPAATAML